MTHDRLRSLTVGVVVVVALIAPAFRAGANSKCDYDNENDAYLRRYAIKVDGVEVDEADPLMLAWNIQGYVMVRRLEDPNEIVDHWNISNLPEEGDLIYAYGTVEGD